jgi:hypothetical protein
MKAALAAKFDQKRIANQLHGLRSPRRIKPQGFT